jgi:hypothetical protein
MDLGSCEVIQHLLGVTKTVESTILEKETNVKAPEKKGSNYSKSKGETAKSFDDDGDYPKKQNDEYPKKQKDTCSTQRLVN